jgi:hypothetical protein
MSPLPLILDISNIKEKFNDVSPTRVGFNYRLNSHASDIRNRMKSILARYVCRCCQTGMENPG